MKLRLSKQNLRFRLNPKDMTELTEKKSVRDQIHITPEIVWGYNLTLTSVLSTQVFSKGSHVEVQVPEIEFLNWLASQEIEWNYQQHEPPLLVCIEKDLKPNRI
ncbi:MAG: hypothetical protein H7256_10725 [Bdellovibrio sp.]|nr:hypothetical protein [Bdellovibrio sp.]